MEECGQEHGEGGSFRIERKIPFFFIFFFLQPPRRHSDRLGSQSMVPLCGALKRLLLSDDDDPLITTFLSIYFPPGRLLIDIYLYICIPFLV